MVRSAGPLEIILQDIERALQAQLWYVALAVTLSLPDICSLLEMSQPWSSRKTYADWFDKNAGRHFRWFTGDDCYSLRGGVVHHGKFGHAKARYDRIGFTIPRNGMVIGEVLADNRGTRSGKGTVLTMDLALFCDFMIRSVRDWFAAHCDDANVRENLPNLVRMHPNGIDGHIRGFPVIASGPDPYDDLGPRANQL